MSLSDQTPTVISLGEDSLERMVLAAENVRQRRSRIISALEAAKVPFGIFGSTATYVWIECIDESAVRQYRNIEFLIQREHAELATKALIELDLTPETHPDSILFRYKDTQRERCTDRAYFAGERLLKRDVPLPCIESLLDLNGVPVVGLEELVIFQLSRMLRDDLVDLRDMIDVGLIDQSWTGKLPPELAARLQGILDDPDG